MLGSTATELLSLAVPIITLPLAHGLRQGTSTRRRITAERAGHKTRSETEKAEMWNSSLLLRREY
jgi:hypothetical protein